MRSMYRVEGRAWIPSSISVEGSGRSCQRELELLLAYEGREGLPWRAADRQYIYASRCYSQPLSPAMAHAESQRIGRAVASRNVAGSIAAGARSQCLTVERHWLVLGLAERGNPRPVAVVPTSCSRRPLLSHPDVYRRVRGKIYFPQQFQSLVAMLVGKGVTRWAQGDRVSPCTARTSRFHVVHLEVPPIPTAAARKGAEEKGMCSELPFVPSCGTTAPSSHALRFRLLQRIAARL